MRIYFHIAFGDTSINSEGYENDLNEKKTNSRRGRSFQSGLVDLLLPLFALGWELNVLFLGTCLIVTALEDHNLPEVEPTDLKEWCLLLKNCGP